MAMIFLVIVFLSVYVNVWLNVRKTHIVNGDTAFALPYTVIIFFGYLFIVTELLSLINAITFMPLLGSWILLLALNIIYIIWNIRKYGFDKAEILSEIRLSKNERVVITLFGIFSVVMLVLAYYTAPYNLDSLVCYLPKIMHWAQNRSIGHYAAVGAEQISTPDFAQYIRLHVFVLSGYKDQLFTLVQCVSYLVDALLVYLIAQRVGCRKEWSYVAACIFLSLPITFAEALNTQYDLVTAVFVLAFVLMLLYYFEDTSRINIKEQGIVHTGSMGVCIGLAFITKQTTGFALAIFILWLLIICCRAKIEWKTILISIGVAAIPAIIFVLPKAFRLYDTFGTFLPEEFSVSHIVNTVDPRLLLLCFVKNLTFSFSGHYVYMSKNFVEKGVGTLANILHIDLVDPRISLYDSFTLNEPFDYNHDRATGELICILFCIAFIIGLAVLLKRKFDGYVFAYTSATFAAFILFLTLMKFTTHRTRYEISYFALLCPAVCIIFQQYLKSKTQIVFRTCILFYCTCEIISMFAYHSDISMKANGGERPLAYFKYQDYTSYIYDSYLHVAGKIKEKGYATVGLTGEPWFEYPIWAMTQDCVERIESVNIENETSIHEDQEYYPDCILYMGTDEMKGSENISCHGLEYEIIDRVFDGGYTWYIIAERL